MFWTKSVGGKKEKNERVDSLPEITAMITIIRNSASTSSSGKPKRGEPHPSKIITIINYPNTFDHNLSSSNYFNYYYSYRNSALKYSFWKKKKPFELQLIGK